MTNDTLESHLRRMHPRPMPAAPRERIRSMLDAHDPESPAHRHHPLPFAQGVRMLAASLLITLVGMHLLTVAPSARPDLPSCLHTTDLPVALVTGNTNMGTALSADPDPAIHNNVVAVIDSPAQVTNTPPKWL